MPQLSRITVFALAAFLGLSANALGEQSLVLEPGTVGKYRISATDIPNGLGDFRVEFRIHDFGGCQENYANIWDFGAIEIRCHLAGLNQLGIVDGAAGIGLQVDMAQRPDSIFRVQRDATAGELTVEVWNPDGSGYLRQSRKGASVGARSVTGPLSVGGSQTKVKIAWMRWLTSRVPLGSPLPSAGDAGLTDLLAEWKFETNGQDSSSHRLDLAISLKFDSSPLHPPVAVPSVSFVAKPVAPVVKAADDFTLSGLQSRSVGSGSITDYRWEQVAGPSQVQIVSPNAAVTSIKGAKVGEYRFRLTVRDQSGAEDTDVLAVGVVAADDRGVITQAGSGLDMILGPQIRWGASPWPYLDQIHQDLADAFGAALEEPNWIDDFNTPLAGTVNLASGSPVVYGSGTFFQTEFCGEPGKTEPTGARFVAWYPRPSGGFGRRAYRVESCPSQQELQLASPYSLESGIVPARILGVPRSYPLQHSKMACLGCWINQSNNINYYDAVLAFYSLYARSGLEIYRTYARELADRWWSMPYMDQGGCLPNDCVGAPRIWSLAGMMARAMDGRPDMWPGISKFLDYAAPIVTRPRDLYDLREEAYLIAFLSIGARLAPDEQARQRYRAAVIQSLEKRWLPQQQPEGHWVNFSYGYQGRNSRPPSTVNTEHGSALIVGVGTKGFWPKDPANNWILVADDAEAYYVLPGSDDQSLLLDRPYQGPTGTKRDYQLNNLVGYGTQPFTMGIVATAWSYAFQATGDQRARQLVLDTASWIADQGMRPGTRGLYYARGFPPCEPDPDSAPNCMSGAPDDPDIKSRERFLNGEVLNAFSQAYLLSGELAFRDAGDNLVGAALGKQGGPMSDEFFSSELDETAQSRKWKNFGFYFGFGMAPSWPAARVMRGAAVEPRQLNTVRTPAPRVAPTGVEKNRDIQ